MPASPARALRGRVWRLAAGVFASALAALALTPASRAADREVTVGAVAPATWEGRAALASALFDPATLTPCGTSVADVCDTTLVHVLGAGTLSIELAEIDAGTADVDLYVYRSDAFGIAGPLAAASADFGPREAVHLPSATGSYLVAARSFSAGSAGFAGRASLAYRAAGPPDIDDPRGRQEALVSDVREGAASQPAVAASPRDPDVLVAAYRVFGSTNTYVSRIATAVSFDRGARWRALGAVAATSAANPALAFDAGGDALLLTNEQSASGRWGVTVRRWTRPAPSDVAHRRTWEAPRTLDEPPAGADDERPVLAPSRAGGLLACWLRDTDLGAYGRQAVLCRSSTDGGAGWQPPSQPSPHSTAGVPFGPYVGGVAVAHRRGAFTVAWIDTLAGVLDGSGLDSAWVARSTDGAAWSAPVRVARFRPLPQHFAGDGFRNVGLLSLAGARNRLYLAFAAEVGGQADVQLVRSDDAGAHWGQAVTVGADESGAAQFQPSLAVTRAGEVLVSFLDRRLGASFADEWLARSRDGGQTWSELRLSHDSWDPAIGAPHSPTGDLLGDHQALVAAGCSAVALAADPHLANTRRRDRGFDGAMPRSALPQLFAWTVPARSRRC